MQNDSFVVLHLYILSNKNCELYVCGARLSRKDTIKEGRSRYTRAEAEKRPGCFYSDSPPDGTVPSQNVVRGDIGAFSRVSKNKGESNIFQKKLYLALIISEVMEKI